MNRLFVEVLQLKNERKNAAAYSARHFSLSTNEPAQMKKKKTYAQQSFTASASRGRRFSPIIIRSLSRLRLSRGLDKPSPKLLGKDKLWLELAVA